MCKNLPEMSIPEIELGLGPKLGQTHRICNCFSVSRVGYEAYLFTVLYSLSVFLTIQTGKSKFHNRDEMTSLNPDLETTGECSKSGESQSRSESSNTSTECGPQNKCEAHETKVGRKCRKILFWIREKTFRIEKVLEDQWLQLQHHCNPSSERTKLYQIWPGKNVPTCSIIIIFLSPCPVSLIRLTGIFLRRETHLRPGSERIDLNNQFYHSVKLDFFSLHWR